MGFAASQARLMMLTARKSDLELEQQFLSQARMRLANFVGQLFNISANLEPDSPQVHQLQQRISAIQSIDKALELQMKRIDTQHEAVSTEIDSVRKIISKNIASSFKLFG